MKIKMILFVLQFFFSVYCLNGQNNIIKSVKFSDNMYDILFENKSDSSILIPNFRLRFKDIESFELKNEFYKVNNDTIFISMLTCLKNVNDIYVLDKGKNTQINLFYNDIVLEPQKRFHQYFCIPFTENNITILVLNFNEVRYEMKIDK